MIYYKYLNKSTAHIITKRLSEVLSQCTLIEYDEYNGGVLCVKQFKYSTYYGNTPSTFWVSIYSDGIISFNARVATGQLIYDYNIREIALEDHLKIAVRDMSLCELITE